VGFVDVGTDVAFWLELLEVIGLDVVDCLELLHEGAGVLVVIWN